MIIEVKNLKRIFIKEIKKGWFKKEKKEYTAVDNISFNVVFRLFILISTPSGSDFWLCHLLPLRHLKNNHLLLQPPSHFRKSY